MINNLDLAYLGGLYDGEGHIGLHARKMGQSEQIMPMITLVNCNLVIIENARRILDEHNIAYFMRGFTSENPKHRKRYTITMTGMKRALRFAKVIEPYLVGKREQARILIAFSLSRLALGTMYNHVPYRKIERYLLGYIKELNADGHRTVILNEHTSEAKEFVAKMCSELRAKDAELAEMSNRLFEQV